jgi:hypothetical protein
MDPMPKDLPNAVRTALRRWYAGPQKDQPWREMLVVSQHLADAPVPDHNLAVKGVLLDALRRMEEQVGSDAVQILRLRFLDVLTASATANRLNLTQDIVYKRQRAAIVDLARIIWRLELEIRTARNRKMIGRLDFTEPPRLFGVDDKLSELTAALTAQAAPWLVAVVGIGGIGKTSLADAAVRALVARPAFADIAWVSARQERFTVWNGRQKVPESAPALTVEGLLDAVIEQFGFHDLNRYPLVQKRDQLRVRLRARPYLVVVDNLETAADYRALVPDLQGWVNPTRFLLTSRRSLHDYPGIYTLSLDELSAADSLALLHDEASERGLTDVAAAPDETLLQIYEVAGGNPLALKLLVGQMHTLSLSQVVHDLRQAQGQRMEELYHFIYWRSWQLLSDEARRVLTVMPLVAESGGGLEHIAALSELPHDVLSAALRQLVGLCLIHVRGTVEARRYGIHRLTETFLLNEVLKWRAKS